MRRFRLLRVKDGLRQVLQRVCVERQRGVTAQANFATNTVCYPADWQPFRHFAVGMPFGPYHERITIVHLARKGEAAPAWFKPKRNENHIALFQGDRAVYLCLDLDRAARDAAAPFERYLEPTADRHVAPTLFDQP